MRNMRKVIVSSMIGNALEWYDFALYGHFVTIIGRLFFPGNNAYVSLILAFGVFAAGFFMRPLGAIIFGYIGDRFGRKIALMSSILTMAVPTACIGILPGYASIGIFAPILLTVIRLLQGLSLGGAFSGSIAFVVEHAPDNKRGISGSTAMMSMNIGILIGSAVAFLFSYFMSAEVFESWGWRIPFILGLLVGLVAIYIRGHLHESPKYEAAKLEGTIDKRPLNSLLSNHFSALIMGVVLYICVTIPFYTLVIFMKTYMKEFVGVSFDKASLMSTIAISVCTVLLPVGGYLSDKYGRKIILLVSGMGYILLTYPVFYLMHQHGFWQPLMGEVIFAILVAFYMGPMPAILAELFPTSVRFTGIALSYNLSAALLGGTLPSAATWMIATTGNNFAIAYYIIGFAIFTFVCTYLFYKESLKIQLA